MDDVKAIRQKVYILLFGIATLAFSLVFAYLRAREVYLANGGGLTIEEGYQNFGDSAVWAIWMTTMIVWFIIAPLTYIVSSSIIYGIGFILVHWKSNQVNFVKYWLVYPVFSIIILIGYYLFLLFL